MPSTYTLNNGIELIGTGEQSGTWGDTTNTNFELLDTALDGQVSVTLAATGSSGSPNTLPISDGASSNGRNRLVIFGDGGDLGGTAFVQLTPNDAEKIIYVRNNLSGSRSILLFQGTYSASNDYEIPAGTTAIVFFNGAGTGAVAANVFNNAYFDSLRLGSVSVTAILDEDNMASDSATALATQQSIKAYVDTQVGANNELSEVLANGNTTGGTDIAVSTGDDITFADSSKAIFGAGSDLQIYHDGTNSYIVNTTNDLIIGEDTRVRIKTPSLLVNNAADTENLLTATENGAVTLYYDNASKLATTSTGVDITGTLTSDGLTVTQTGSTTAKIGATGTSGDNDGTLIINNGGTGDGMLRFDYESNTDRARIGVSASNQNLQFFTAGNNERMLIDSSGNVGIGNSTPSNNHANANNLVVGNGTAGGIANYVGTGLGWYAFSRANANNSDAYDGGISYDGSRNLMFHTNAGSERMRIDASGNVGIGTSSPDKLVHLKTSVNNTAVLRIESTATDSYPFLSLKNDAREYQLAAHGPLGDVFTIYDGTAGSHRFVIDSSGNVGIGTTSPAWQLHVKGTSNAVVQIEGASSAGSFVNFGDSSDTDVGQIGYDHTSNYMRFKTNDTERMRIDSSGNVGIGTSSPSRVAELYNTSNPALRINNGTDIADIGLASSAGSFATGSTSGALVIARGGANDINFATNGTSRMTIDSNGNINISSDDKQIYWGAGTTAIDASSANNRIRFFTSNTEAMRIDSSGNVGIGTTSPNGKLDITGSGNTDLYLNTGNNSGDNTRIFFGDTADIDVAYLAYDHGTNSMLFGANAAERMRIDSSGNVGIGTSSPSSLLSLQNVGGGSGGYLKVSDAVHGGDVRFGMADGINNDAIAGAFSNNDFRFYTNSAERMSITSSGSIKMPDVYTDTTASAVNLHISSAGGQLFRSTSSARYKNTIANASFGIVELMALRPVTYKGNNDGDTVFGGLIAEEVHDAGLVEFVQYNEEGEPDALAYGNMVSLCIKAIQEQQATITALTDRITALENA